MIVLDASVALEVLLQTPLGQRCAKHVFGIPRHAPHLIDVEFAHTLRRLVRLGHIDAAAAQQGLDNLRALNINRHAHTGLLARVWELRDSLSAYDACYAALAEGLNVPLMTCDARLSRSRGHRADIVLLS